MHDYPEGGLTLTPYQASEHRPTRRHPDPTALIEPPDRTLTTDPKGRSSTPSSDKPTTSQPFLCFLLEPLAKLSRSRLRPSMEDLTLCSSSMKFSGGSARAARKMLTMHCLLRQDEQHTTYTTHMEPARDVQS